MTTKIATRRLTMQPDANSDYHEENPFVDAQAAVDVQGIYDRHGSPQKTAMQVFG